ncbi:MAG TPA: AmmeMemoRadiSam system protein B [Spirochaetaceae bacterium]|nr:AmmeMemoRadiSam system protein B [Spirochaetaceae bacterium]
MSISAAIAPRNEKLRVRNPVVSGIFYPSKRQDLDEKIDKLLASAAHIVDRDPEIGACSAIISPHGSLDYSGAIAAKAWKAISTRDIRTIVILSPSHRSFEPGIFMPESEAFSLPSTTFFIDRLAVEALLHSSTSLNLSDIPHFEEHSIEMQLIFAARCFPHALILPIIICGADDQILDALFSNLRYMLGDRLPSTLLVLTTNLAVDTDADSCLKRSAAFVESVEKGDAAQLSSFYGSEPSFCGGSIVAAYMRSSFFSGSAAIIYGLGSSVAFAEEGEPIVGYAAIGFQGKVV